MNKVLTISLVAVLGVLGGGAYLLSESDKNFSEYVPEPVTSLIGDYLPDNFKAKQQTIVENVVETPQYSTMVEETVEVVEDSVQIEPEVQEVALPVESVQEVVDEDTQQNTQQEIEQVTEQDVEESAEQDVLEQSDENVVELAMQEIQKSLDDASMPVEVTSNNPKAKVIEKKIVAASTKISKLDIENKVLEEKFQNILRKNRELAKQLQEMDKQLVKPN